MKRRRLDGPPRRRGARQPLWPQGGGPRSHRAGIVGRRPQADPPGANRHVVEGRTSPVWARGRRLPAGAAADWRTIGELQGVAVREVDVQAGRMVLRDTRARNDHTVPLPRQALEKLARQGTVPRPSEPSAVRCARVPATAASSGARRCTPPCRRCTAAGTPAAPSAALATPPAERTTACPPSPPHARQTRSRRDRSQRLRRPWTRCCWRSPSSSCRG